MGAPGMIVACDRQQSFAFQPERTALLSIDYQRDFLDDDGMCAARGLPTGNLARVLPVARPVLDAARRLGMFVLHTRECYAPDLSDLNAYRRVRDSIIGTPGPLGRFLIRTDDGTAIVPLMAPLEGEPVIDKAGFNAFYGTELDRILQRRGITHLLLMGITTQCCVSSTLRGAVDHGYFPLLLQDCCAAYDQQDHDASVQVIFSENHTFGWVSDSVRLAAAIAGAA